jgi:Rrf2 family nitric oxide-sensitive transcriptional repressor
MFSQTVEYALRAVVVLAQNPDNPQTAQNIAAAAQLPADYLIKVMQALGRAGLVGAQRGKHGGFSLSRDPADLTILDIINAVDPIRRIHFCPLKIKAHGTHLCPLHRKLDAAMATVEESFRTTTLAELLSEPAPYQPLCGEIVHVTAKTV